MEALGGGAVSYERATPVHPHSCEEDLLAMVNACDAEAVTLSVGTLLCPYGIVYRRAYGVFTSGLFKTCL